MTSQPPPPPGGPGQPGPGEQPPQQPPYGQPQQPWGQQAQPPQPPQPWGQQPQQPWGQPPEGGFAPPGAGAPGRSRTSVDFSKVGLFERLIAGSALLFTLFMLLPWYGFDEEGIDDVDASTNGFSDAVGFGDFTFDIGYVTWPAVLAWLLVLAAAVWVLLPAFTTVRVPVPHSVVTAGLTGLAALLFLITWIDQLGLADGPDDEAGFSIVAFLALLTVLGAFVLAVLSLLRARKATGGWPDASGTGHQQHGPAQQPPPEQHQQQPYGQQQPYQPPPVPPSQPYGQQGPPPAEPGRPGGIA